MSGVYVSGDGGDMSDTFQIDLSNRWPLQKAMEYVKDLPHPKQFSLMWLMNQLPEGVSIEFPRTTETFVDLNAREETK